MKSSADAANTRKLVLYIHDDAGTLHFRKLMLERHGYEVVSAICSSDAAGQLNGTSFDLIVADHVSTKCYERFTAEIRRLRPEVPLLVLSEGAGEGAETEFDSHLPKASGEEFLRKVESLTGREPRRTANLKTEPSSEPPRDLLAAIVESSDDAIFSKTLDGVVTSWNPAAEKMYGYTRQEIVGKPVSTLIPRERLPELQDIMRRLRAGERIAKLETERVRKDGSRVQVTLNISPIYARDGRLIGASDTAHDMSQLRRAEEALRSSERLATAGRLVATVAHEINNPLEVLSNILFLLEQNPSLDDSGREWLRAGEEELRRVMQIARLTLTFHRDKGTKTSAVSLPEVVDNVLNLYDRKIKSSGIVVERQFRSQKLIEAVAGEVRQVISNMIVNAVDALTGNGTRLLVRVDEAPSPCSPSTDSLRLTIADNGSGISEHDLKRLFQPFFTTKGDQGTGIGLWVSRGIVEKHGGCIRFRSRSSGPHRGTVFQIYLPLVQAQSSKLA